MIQERSFKDNADNQSSGRKATLVARFTEDRKVNKALKLLESSSKGGILPLTDETLEVLLEKHPKASIAFSDVLKKKKLKMYVIYESIDSEVVADASKKTWFCWPLGLRC